MNYNITNGKKISQMTLGTVQLGLNYGIANTSGQPDTEKSHAMLNSAIENDITSFDTARAYGTAEDVLGTFIKSRKSNDDLFITSKLIVSLPENASEDEVESTMFSSVETSFEKLGLEKLDCLMLHRGEEITKYGNVVSRILEKMLAKGYIDSAGVSVYTPEEIDTMLQFDVFSATQLPMNIFDQKLIHTGYLDKLKEKSFTVFVRSVFLQGLFFLNPDKFTDPILIEYVKPYSIKLLDLCRVTGMSVAQMAISFIRDVPGVTSLVLGADTPEQVKQNVAYMSAPTLSSDIRREIYGLFKNVDIKKIMEVLSRPKR